MIFCIIKIKHNIEKGYSFIKRFEAKKLNNKYQANFSGKNPIRLDIRCFLH